MLAYLQYKIRFKHLHVWNDLLGWEWVLHVMIIAKVRHWQLWNKWCNVVLVCGVLFNDASWVDVQRELINHKTSALLEVNSAVCLQFILHIVRNSWPRLTSHSCLYTVNDQPQAIQSGSCYHVCTARMWKNLLRIIWSVPKSTLRSRPCSWLMLIFITFFTLLAWISFE